MTDRISEKLRKLPRQKRLRWDREVEMDTDYAHATGRIRILEEQFLSFSDYEILAGDSTSDNERSQILDRAGYPAGNNLEERVLAARAANNELLRELDKDGVLTRALLLDVDYHNLKLLMKHYLLAEVVAETSTSDDVIDQSNADDLPITLKRLLIHDGYTPVQLLRTEILTLLSMERQDMAEAVSSDSVPVEQLNPDAIDPILRMAILRLIMAWQAHQETVTIDIEADKLYFEHAKYLAEARSSGSARWFLKDYFSLKADLANLQMLLRIRRFKGGRQYLNRVLVTGGEVSEASILDAYDAPADVLASFWREKASLAVELADFIPHYTDENGIWLLGEASDNLLVRLAEHSRRQSFSADTVAGFWLSRQFEGQNLRILFSGLEREYSGEDLLILLRHVYKRGTK